jgi:hypothetical protein
MPGSSSRTTASEPSRVTSAAGVKPNADRAARGPKARRAIVSTSANGLLHNVKLLIFTSP